VSVADYHRLSYLNATYCSTSKDAAKEAEASTSSDNAPAKEGEEGQTETAEGQEEEQEEETKKKRDFVPDHAIKRDAKWTDNNARKKNSYGGAGRISQPAGKGFAS
jgi:hypothetical protein